MQALIVAAGRSSRLYPLTSDTPKPLLEIGGRSLIQRSVDLLSANGIRDITVVVGFRHEKIRAALSGRVQFVLNPFFESCNNMASLWLALPYLTGEEFIYQHGDIICDEALMARLVEPDTGEGIDLLVDFESIDEEAMKVRTVDGQFRESDKAIPKDEAAGEWTGIARISPSATQALKEEIEVLLAQGLLQSYDTAAFNRMALRRVPFGLLPTGGLPWCEIDTAADLQRARSLFDGR